MLAQNFKTPTDLGIPEDEFFGLVRVLGEFERGEIRPEQFDMRQWCGSACCISGHALKYDCDLRASTPGLAALLVPGPHDLEVGKYGKTMKDILPEHAAIAIRNYLTHGEPRWGEALAS
jgi:hypothetical protein